MGRIQVWALVWGGAAAAVFLVACSSTSDGTADGAAGVEDAQSAPTRDAERADTAGSVDTSAEASGGAEAAASVEGDEDAGGVEGEEAASEGEEEADEDVEVGPVRFVGDPFVGACWALPEGEFRFAVAPLLSCEGPHQSEVFWLGLPPLALLQAGYSESELFDAVGPICNAALFGYQGGSSSESLQIFVQLPTEEEWAAGRFVYSCSAFDGGGQLLAGSLRVEAAGFPLGVVFAAREREAYVGLRFVRDDGLAIPVDVASPNGVVRDVAWFPDGQRVVFAARGDNSQAFNLFTLDGLQRPLVQLTDTFADNVSPTVSPDGTRIAFASARDGNLELYVMDADGRNVRRLTETPDLAENSPSWSPDSSQIAFELSGAGGGWSNIAVLDAATGTVSELTDSSLFYSWPAWSPDGRRIAFSSPAGGRDDIWIMSADGSDPQQFTVTEAGGIRAAAWRPRPLEEFFGPREAASRAYDETARAVSSAMNRALAADEVGDAIELASELVAALDAFIADLESLQAPGVVVLLHSQGIAGNRQVREALSGLPGAVGGATTAEGFRAAFASYVELIPVGQIFLAANFPCGSLEIRAFELGIRVDLRCGGLGDGYAYGPGTG